MKSVPCCMLLAIAWLLETGCFITRPNRAIFPSSDHFYTTIFSSSSSSSSFFSSRDTTNELESIRGLDNRQLKEELKQLIFALNGDPMTLNGIYDRRELERLLAVTRVRYKQMIENEKRVRDRQRAEEARAIKNEVKRLDKTKSYQDIINELRFYKVDFDPLDERKNLITTLALARLNLLDDGSSSINTVPTENAFTTASTATGFKSSSSSSSWNPFGRNSTNSFLRQDFSGLPKIPTIPSIPKMPDVKLDFPGSVLSQVAGVTSLFEVENEVNKLRQRRRQVVRERRTTGDIDSDAPYTEIEFGTLSNSPGTSNSEDDVAAVDSNDEVEEVPSDTSNRVTNNVPFKWSVTSGPAVIEPPPSSTSRRSSPPGKRLQPTRPTSSSVTGQYRTTRLEREEIATVDSVKLASDLIMKSFLGPVILATQAVLKPYLPRALRWEGPRKAAQFLRTAVLGVVMQLAIWATGDKHTASLLLFSTTTLCVIARKGIVWFVLSFLMVRTVRLAIFSGAVDALMKSDKSNGDEKVSDVKYDKAGDDSSQSPSSSQSTDDSPLKS